MTANRRARIAVVAAMSAFATVGTHSACSRGITSSEVHADDAAADEAGDGSGFDLAPTHVPPRTLPDSWSVGDGPRDAGPGPAVSCGPDAAHDGALDSDADADGVASSAECPLPISRCVEGDWVESYINGVCEDGLCRWWRVYHYCSEGCRDGACSRPPIPK